MLAVRYAALAGLVVWLGGMIALELLGETPVAEELRRFHLVAYVCGALVFVSLFLIKFIGPPPQAFVPRIAIVALMLALELYADRRHQAWATFVPVNAALGLALLFWYIRE